MRISALYLAPFAGPHATVTHVYQNPSTAGRTVTKKRLPNWSQLLIANLPPRADAANGAPMTSVAGWPNPGNRPPCGGLLKADPNVGMAALDFAGEEFFPRPKEDADPAGEATPKLKPDPAAVNMAPLDLACGGATVGLACGNAVLPKIELDPATVCAASEIEPPPEEGRETAGVTSFLGRSKATHEPSFNCS